VDYTNLGGRATDILRLAEEQAREVIERATEDSERLKETARRGAGITEIQQLRLRGQEDVRLQIERAQAEAEAIVAAARREAEALQRAADHEAQTMRQNAYLDTEKLRREVELEVADLRQGIATERDAAIGHLRGVHEESVAKTTALLTEATEYHRQATERLDRDIAEAARVRAEALAEAEAVKLQAVQEAEERIAAARKQAAAITDRTQQEFAWRKQQLRRETDLLGQRKAAVLNQLASLSALAEQTAHAFPDLEDLDDFDGEQGDRTVMMPAAMAPSMPPQNGSVPRPATPPQAEGQGSDAAAVAEPDTAEEQGDRDESSTETRVFKPVSGPDHPSTGSEESEDPEGEPEDTIQMDGDATVMVPASQLPAGTGHLQGNGNVPTKS
jgi:hypothetical protein